MPEIRPAAIDDPASIALDNEVWRDDDAVSAAEVRTVADWFLEHATWNAIVDGEPRATVFVGIPPHREEVSVRLVVPPRFRRHGLGAALWRVASAWAAERGHDELHASIPGGDPDGLAWAERRGYVVTGREEKLVLDLARAELPPAQPPRGVELSSLAEHPELERGVYDVAAESWVDIPGHEGDTIEPFADWQQLFADADRFPRAATVLALADGRVVGYSQLQLRSPTLGWNSMTGVRRDWRGKGVAGALKLAQLRWAKHAGIERITTLNEERNEPIRRLNERLGYVRAPGRIRVRGPLAPSDEP